VVGTSQLLALVVALPIGVYAAMRPYSIFDQLANTLAFIGFSRSQTRHRFGIDRSRDGISLKCAKNERNRTKVR
jgi:hypothetical protein